MTNHHALRRALSGLERVNRPVRDLVVLAIDDDPDALALIGHHLRKVPGWDVEFLPFSDPREGLQVLSERSVGVVLLDYQMGKLTGMDVFEDIQLLDPDVPVLLLTAQGDEQLAVAALHAGMADYLPKQRISPQSLRRSIGNSIEKFALRRSLNEYRQSLERTVRELEARNEEIGSFYHTLSHELKTPLTGTREFISIVLEGIQGELNADQRESLERAKYGCDQMVMLIDDILDTSRLDTGKLTVDLRPGRVEGVVGRAVEQAVPSARDAGITLDAVVPADLPRGCLDERRTLQVVSNLLGNALKFTGRGGTVAVEVHRDGEWLHVAVRDSGRGIEPQRLERVFDRLYQTSEGDAALQGGLGLGLHLCRELVRLQGGEIDVESVLGQGSVFSFTLPVAREPHGETPPGDTT